MDEDIAEMIAQLCTRVGMIMEDHSDVALTMVAQPPETWPAVLDRLQNAAVEISALMAAAQVLTEKSRPHR